MLYTYILMSLSIFRFLIDQVSTEGFLCDLSILPELFGSFSLVNTKIAEPS